MQGAEGGGGFRPLDAIRNRIQKTVAESRIPTENIKSTMVIYGGKMVTDPEGKMVFDRRGPVSKIDMGGDRVLRNYDEHVIQDPFKLLRRHPTWFFRLFMPGAKRYKGSNQEIESNIQKLGLEDYYAQHPWGIEIKKPEVFTQGIPFQDVLRADLIGSEKLNGIDRFKAIAEVAKYLRHIHDNFGGIGEGVPYRFIFQRQEGNNVSDPVLYIPDIVYNNKATPADQKATDYLEFLMSIGFEEFRRSSNWTNVDKALDGANKAYGDRKVIGITGSFAKRGRLTLEHPVFSQHNRVHLGFDPRYTAEIRQKVIDACERFKKPS